MTDTTNPWGELKVLMREKEPPSVFVRLVGGIDVEGSVIKVVEGWVKLMPHDIGEPVWLNMDHIVAWSIQP